MPASGIDDNAELTPVREKIPDDNTTDITNTKRQVTPERQVIPPITRTSPVTKSYLDNSAAGSSICYKSHMALAKNETKYNLPKTNSTAG